MAKACTAAVVIRGETYRCQLERGHEAPGRDGSPGLAHSNEQAQAIWIGSGER